MNFGVISLVCLTLLISFSAVLQADFNSITVFSKTFLSWLDFFPSQVVLLQISILYFISHFLDLFFNCIDTKKKMIFKNVLFSIVNYCHYYAFLCSSENYALFCTLESFDNSMKLFFPQLIYLHIVHKILLSFLSSVVFTKKYFSDIIWMKN